jgi:hypothetical protein
MALVLTALAPTGAWAAKPPPVSKEDRAKGMADAPGLIAAGHFDCQLADARKIGEAQDPKTKVKTAYYELACAGGEGLVAIRAGDAAPTEFTCLETAAPGPDGKPSPVACILPGNQDPKAGLAPYVAKATTPCTLTNARGIGHNDTATLFELVCAEATGGYILQTSAPPRLDQPVVINPCVAFPESSNVKCTLTDRATQLSVVDKLAAAMGKPCTVKDRGYIATAPTGDVYYEVACVEGRGYVLKQAPNGSLSETIDCINADGIAGGCKLTDTRQAKTEQNGLYAKLAKGAGYDCDVSGYAPLPGSDSFPAHSEVVELTCSNRPDGAVAVFPANSKDPSMIFDCPHAELQGYRCTLSAPSASYGKLTAELAAYGKKSCAVSNARWVGDTNDNHGFIEVACADGLQGYMMEYQVLPVKMTQAIICSDAKGIAGGCTLPGNVKKPS